MDGAEARKVVCKSVLPQYRRRAEREAGILSLVVHSRVVALVNSFQTQFGVIVLLEHPNSGSLQQMISHLEESKCRVAGRLVWSVLAQLAQALAHLDANRVVHRNVSPSTVLVNRIQTGKEGLLEIKLGGFGLARRLGPDGRASGVVGLPPYMAPEMVSGEYYSTPVDVWGLGVSLYELMELRRPFGGRNRDELFEAIREARLPQAAMCADSELESLVRGCLSKDNRIPVQAIEANRRARLHLRMLDIKLQSARQRPGHEAVQ